MGQTNHRIAIEAIKPNPYQRVIRWDRVQYYAAKMGKEGYNESYPVTVDKNNVLVDGGHRIEAAKIVGITEVPCITSNAPRIAHSLRCNRDGADTMPDDVFDLAELCWRLMKDEWSRPQIADELGWSSEAIVTYHKNIKELLCPAAWDLARNVTNNGHLLGMEDDDVVTSKVTIVTWLESHFRAMLAHLPCTDGISAHNQLSLIRDCLARFASDDGKVTAAWIAKEAQRYAWYADLHRYICEHLADEVPLADKLGLLREIYRNAFGKKPSDGNPFDRIASAASVLNERALGVKLYQDDALQRIPLLADDSIALIATDPPYNTTENEWDKIGTDEEYLDFTRCWLEATRPKLKADYHLFVFCAPEYQARVEQLLIANDWPLKSRIIWEYRNLAMGRDVADKFISNWQMCFHCGTHSLNWSQNWSKERFEVQEYATPQSNFKEGRHHPTAKPVGLIELLVRVGSKTGDVVLDMFAGGGTTGEACKNVGQRQCILIEKSPDYCDVIEQRLNIKRREETTSDGRN